MVQNMIAISFRNDSYSTIVFSLKSTRRESKLKNIATSRCRSFIVLLEFVSIVCNPNDLKDLSVRGKNSCNVPWVTSFRAFVSSFRDITIPRAPWISPAVIVQYISFTCELLHDVNTHTGSPSLVHEINPPFQVNVKVISII